jgi:tetratricopeptide (TPR) repeat protein
MKKSLKKSLLVLSLLFAWTLSHAQFNQEIFKKLDLVTQQNPQSSAALFNLGQYFFFNHNFTDALVQIDKALALDSQNADLLFFKGLSHEVMGEYEEALNSYDKTIAAESSTEFQLRRGMLRYKLKKYIGAWQDFKIILEDYADMRSLDKYVKDCEKNGADEGKTLEDNTVKSKAAPENAKTFIEVFIQSYENFGDSGEIYRALSLFYTGNFIATKPIFEKLLSKYNFQEMLFFNGLILEIEQDNLNAVFFYQKAIKKVKSLLLDAQFEQLTGFQGAAADIARLKNVKIDYENKIKALKQEQIQPLTNLQETDADLKGEVKSTRQSYLYSFEQAETVGNRTIYQLVIQKKMGEKVMVARTIVEKKDNQWIVIINHGGQKEKGSLTWSVFPQDFLKATFSETKNPIYHFEGDRMKSARNKKLDLKTLSTLRPTSFTAIDAITFAARVYMAGFIIK